MIPQSPHANTGVGGYTHAYLSLLASVPYCLISQVSQRRIDGPSNDLCKPFVRLTHQPQPRLGPSPRITFDLPELLI